MSTHFIMFVKTNIKEKKRMNEKKDKERKKNIQAGCIARTSGPAIHHLAARWQCVQSAILNKHKYTLKLWRRMKRNEEEGGGQSVSSFYTWDTRYVAKKQKTLRSIWWVYEATKNAHLITPLLSIFLEGSLDSKRLLRSPS